MFITCVNVSILIQRRVAWSEEKGLHHRYCWWETQSHWPLQCTGQTGSVSIHDIFPNRNWRKKRDVWKLISEQAQACVYMWVVNRGAKMILYFQRAVMFSVRARGIRQRSGRIYKTCLNSHAGVYRRINNSNNFCPCLRARRCKWDGTFRDVKHAVEILALVIRDWWERKAFSQPALLIIIYP